MDLFLCRVTNLIMLIKLTVSLYVELGQLGVIQNVHCLYMVTLEFRYI